jgi:hypothetical protein
MSGRLKSGIWHTTISFIAIVVLPEYNPAILN